MSASSSIRAKLVAILLLASTVPLLIGVASVEYLGYRDFRRNQGKLYQASASHLANALGQSVGTQIEKLTDWAALSTIAPEVERTASVSPAQAAMLDTKWPSLAPDSAPIRAVTNNDLARRLRNFQGRNPLFVEIFLTDAHGYLVATTNKTSDFRQADEAWWQKAAKRPRDSVWVEGISYDESARQHALEISLPVYEQNRVVGVIKAVLNVSALFSRVPIAFDEIGLRRDVVTGDGRILARLRRPKYPPFSEKILATASKRLQSEKAGSDWTTMDFDGNGDDDLAGFAPLRLQSPMVDRLALDGLTPMTVVVRNDAARVLEPVNRQLIWQAIASLILVSMLLGAGLYIVQKKLVKPLGLLRVAANGLAATAQFEDANAARAAQEKARELTLQLEQIKTNDEIEELASDFAIMARRVLNYHEHMEKEIGVMTGEIQRDLKMAREFQEALLPRNYPAVPEAGIQDALTLGFHHVYQPASSVCGDFFDVFKVSEGCAGIFIADVMGHGARSALVTAILRTLLQDVSQYEDPALLLQQVNSHFSSILRGTGQFVFASAFCMIVDTVNRKVSFASAGHPSPIFIDRSEKKVTPLLDETFSDPNHLNAALGVDGDSTYTCHRRELQAGDMFFLYTDGVSEAPNRAKEEFGEERLCQSLSWRINYPIARLCRGVCEDVTLWLEGLPSPDDICLVGVEIGSPVGSPSHQASTASENLD
ncbi:phosphoserine phosphatase RsbP [Abditibacteriota bacterium]|nr:phosphoserine phosphatase RsbP [Abditibacteriota bacterium]